MQTLGLNSCRNCSVRQYFRLRQDATPALVRDVHRGLLARRSDDEWVERWFGLPRLDEESWRPADGVRVGVWYRDSIRGWTHCCEKGGRTFLSYIDAPGPFSPQASGTIEFVAIFDESYPDSSFGRLLCPAGSCTAHFRLEVQAGRPARVRPVRLLPYPPGAPNPGCDVAPDGFALGRNTHPIRIRGYINPGPPRPTVPGGP